MLDTPQIVQTTAQLTAVIRLTIPRDQIRHVMGRGYSELMSALSTQGIPTAGPWFSHHLRTDPDIFDFEIGVPVTGLVAPIGRVTASQLPTARVVRTVYHGPYTGLGTAWSEFDDWIVAQGLKTGPDFWECYVQGPESSPDPATWQTQLNRPLVAA